MVYAVPLIIFMDDVSGNVSKQWNKHHVIYMSNANLPREMLEKEFCIRFVTSSPHAAPMELMAAMKDSIAHAAENGVDAWDCKHKEEVMLSPYGLFLGGDNPMQAEECSHAGLNCNFFCRTCHVGGTKVEKQSLAGYAKLCTPGKLRTPEETLAEIKKQASGAILAGDKLKDGVTKTGVRDATTTAVLQCIVELGKKLRKRSEGAAQLSEDEVRKQLEKELERLLQGKGIEEYINPLLGMPGLNVHLDTPTEVLHTVLLGVVKYFWSQTVFVLEKAKALQTFQTRLESVNAQGLDVPALNAEYMCHYKGGLIGKHFKSIAQVMPFAIYDLVPTTLLDAWHVLGKLVVLLWHTKIEDTQEYLVRRVFGV
ncbi:hypothetical protein C8Q77DRAFT_1060980 [Trametes polyzona]|nr:hypothetical protein C8Q77DRAFT_1060980 [Trametes polyzona]